MPNISSVRSKASFIQERRPVLPARGGCATVCSETCAEIIRPPRSNSIANADPVTTSRDLSGCHQHEMWVLRLLTGAFHTRRTYVTSNLDSPTDVKPSKAKSDQLRLRQCSGERPPIRRSYLR